MKYRRIEELALWHRMKDFLREIKSDVIAPMKTQLIEIKKILREEQERAKANGTLSRPAPKAAYIARRRANASGLGPGCPAALNEPLSPIYSAEPDL